MNHYNSLKYYYIRVKTKKRKKEMNFDGFRYLRHFSISFFHSYLRISIYNFRIIWKELFKIIDHTLKMKLNPFLKI